MKHLLFIACLLICCTWGYSQTGEQPPPPPPKKSMRMSPVEISQEYNKLCISFNQSLGKVAVNIVNPTGATAYRNTVTAAAGAQLPVDTAGWINGSYIIRITNEQGDIVCELAYHKE